MEITFRNAMEADIPFILHAFEQVKLASEGRVETSATSQRLKKDLFGEHPKAWVLLACVDGKPVGLTLYSTIYYAEEGLVMWISQFFIEPQYRRTGLFVKMGKEVQEKAKKLGCSFMGGATHNTNNRAKKIYQYFADSELEDLLMYYRKVK